MRTVVDSWRDEAEGGPTEGLYDISSAHSSGLRVVALTDSPLHTDVLDPARVAAAIGAARSKVDVIIIDLHPSYSTLNQAIFDEADRILVPVTPDVPAIRAAVQLRDVAAGLGCRERLAMVVNRANSGLSVADMERTVGHAGPGPDPVRRAPLRPRRQRGPHGHRAVPAREDHERLR